MMFRSLRPAPRLWWRMRMFCAAFAFVAFAACASPAQAAFNVGFTGVGDLSGAVFSSGVSAISADGAVAIGSSFTGPTSTTMFRWTRTGGIVALTPDLSPFATSADGSIVAGVTKVGTGRAARWTAGGGVQFLEPQPDGIFRSQALGISGDGSVIVGMRDTTDGDDGMEAFPGSEAFRWTAGLGLELLGDLPGGRVESFALGASGDGSVVVGYGNEGPNRAFRWTVATGMQSLGVVGPLGESRANAVSFDGTTIVGRSTSLLGTEAFRWTSSGGMVGLGDLPGGPVFSEARAVSGNGNVIVGYGYIVDGLGNNTEQAFIWMPGHGMRNLKTVLQTEFAQNLSGWDLFRANAISADGTTIAGVGRNPAGNFEGWVATIPEPPSLALVALFAPVLARLGRR